MPSPKAKAHWNPTLTGMAVSAIVAVLLIAAGLDGDTPAVTLASVPAVALILGIMAALLHSRRLQSMLWGMLLGLLAGASSSWGLIGQHVAMLFPTVLATVVLFTAIGLLIGGFIEFVQFLHYIAHGNKAKTYRSGPEKR